MNTWGVWSGSPTATPARDRGGGGESEKERKRAPNSRVVSSCIARQFRKNIDNTGTYSRCWCAIVKFRRFSSELIIAEVRLWTSHIRIFTFVLLSIIVYPSSSSYRKETRTDSQCCSPDTNINNNKSTNIIPPSSQDQEKLKTYQETEEEEGGLVITGRRRRRLIFKIIETAIFVAAKTRKGLHQSPYQI